MIHRIGALSLTFLAALTLGCENKSSPPPTPSATPAGTTSTAAAPAPSGSAKAQMANCPTTVSGATTSLNDVEGGIEITVTATDDAAAKDIRARAKHLVDVSKEESPSVKHNQSGAGGGRFGRCPVVVRNTLVEAADIEGGAKITVKPKDPAELDWLRREARERQADIGAPGGKDAGQGKMSHCPSAVTGAATTVKDAKDAVIVTITTKDDASVGEIRERAKHVVAASKKDPKDVQHTGDGNGGGGLGRCPVVIKDTTVDAKDVPGGSEFTVKPEKAEALTALRQEIRDRAQNFTPGAATPATSSSAAPQAASASPRLAPAPKK